MARKIILLTALLTAMLLGTSCAALTTAKEVVIDKADKVAEGYCEGSRAIRMGLRKTANEGAIAGEPQPIKLILCPADEEWEAGRKAFLLPLASATAFEDAILAELLRHGYVDRHGKRLRMIVEEIPEDDDG